MPIYEYEPDDRECLMCEGRVAVIQDASEEPLQFCPHCGLEVRRVISKASIKIGGRTDFDRAARKGFTTFRRSGAGTWEKVAGEGPEGLQRDDAAKPPKKVLDLDQE